MHNVADWLAYEPYERGDAVMDASYSVLHKVSQEPFLPALLRGLGQPTVKEIIEAARRR